MRRAFALTRAVRPRRIACAPPPPQPPPRAPAAASRTGHRHGSRRAAGEQDVAAALRTRSRPLRGGGGAAAAARDVVVGEQDALQERMEEELSEVHERLREYKRTRREDMRVRKKRAEQEKHRAEQKAEELFQVHERLGFPAIPKAEQLDLVVNDNVAPVAAIAPDAWRSLGTGFLSSELAEKYITVTVAEVAEYMDTHGWAEKHLTPRGSQADGFHREKRGDRIVGYYMERGIRWAGGLDVDAQAGCTMDEFLKGEAGGQLRRCFDGRSGRRRPEKTKEKKRPRARRGPRIPGVPDALPPLQ